MADSGTVSDWMIDGRTTYPEFQTVYDRDSDNELVADSERTQSRNVYQFRRHRIEPTVAIGGSLPDTDITDSSEAATLSGYQGANDIDAGTIHTGESRKYVCVADDHGSPSVGATWMIRSQVWEMRGPWAEYTWPT